MIKISTCNLKNNRIFLSVKNGFLVYILFILVGLLIRSQVAQPQEMGVFYNSYLTLQDLKTASVFSHLIFILIFIVFRYFFNKLNNLSYLILSVGFFYILQVINSYYPLNTMNPVKYSDIINYGHNNIFKATTHTYLLFIEKNFNKINETSSYRIKNKIGDLFIEFYIASNQNNTIKTYMFRLRTNFLFFRLSDYLYLENIKLTSDNIYNITYKVFYFIDKNKIEYNNFPIKIIYMCPEEPNDLIYRYFYSLATEYKCKGDNILFYGVQYIFFCILINFILLLFTKLFKRFEWNC
jgi:hypothetical protein